MTTSRLVVVTATTNYERAAHCIASWGVVPVVIVANAERDVPPNEVKPQLTSWLVYDDYLGTVEAFKRGVDYVLGQIPSAEVIACLHDDVILSDPDWTTKVLRHFDTHPVTGLLGFGGAIGLGDDDLYQKPYAPVQLARKGFRSNMVDAEVHGIRSLLAERVACLDGFSQIGRREFWEGQYLDRTQQSYEPDTLELDILPRPWTVLSDLKIRHHFYDGALGCLAARAGWETWYLPIRCRHLGGQTAVGDEGYQAWAKRQHAQGDHGFWEQAHAISYQEFKDVLPLRV